MKFILITFVNKFTILQDPFIRTGNKLLRRRHFHLFCAIREKEGKHNCSKIDAIVQPQPSAKQYVSIATL